MLYVLKGFLVAMLAAVAAGVGVGAATGSWRAGGLVGMIGALAAIPLAARIVYRPEQAERRPWPEH
jgi:hypothetical protein